MELVCQHCFGGYCPKETVCSGCVSNLPPVGQHIIDMSPDHFNEHLSPNDGPSYINCRKHGRTMAPSCNYCEKGRKRKGLVQCMLL